MQNQIKEALSFADGPYRLAADHGFAYLAKQNEGIRSQIIKRK